MRVARGMASASFSSLVFLGRLVFLGASLSSTSPCSFPSFPSFLALIFRLVFDGDTAALEASSSLISLVFSGLLLLGGGLISANFSLSIFVAFQRFED